MSSTPTRVTSIEEPNAGPEKQATKPRTKKPEKKPKPGPKPAGERPTKYLPTPRITFSKQLDILRAWAAASGPTGKVASNDAVAEIVKMQPSTVSLANPFFASAGLLTKTDGGYIPSAEVISFLRAYEWSPETAAQKLASILSKTWFAEELISKLAFGPMNKDEAIQDLADAANAAPEYRGQLEMLLDYLNAVGLIQHDGNQVKKGSVNVVNVGSAMSSQADVSSSQKQETAPTAESAAKTMVPSLFGTTEGAVNFHVSVRVDMGEFANWKPDRIASFFAGMAQVLAAKAKIEKEE